MNNLRPYVVMVTWMMAHEVCVIAESLEEAIRKVENDEVDIDVDEDGMYVDSSFEINRECTAEVNR